MTDVTPFRIDISSPGTGVRIKLDNLLHEIIDDDRRKLLGDKWTANEMVLVRTGPNTVERFWVGRKTSKYE